MNIYGTMTWNKFTHFMLTITRKSSSTVEDIGYITERTEGGNTVPSMNIKAMKVWHVSSVHYFCFDLRIFTKPWQLLWPITTQLAAIDVFIKVAFRLDFHIRQTAGLCCSSIDSLILLLCFLKCGFSTAKTTNHWRTISMKAKNCNFAHTFELHNVMFPVILIQLDSRVAAENWVRT